ncbi:hypothetical protein H6F74_14855 [Trichocoleus sp. FACHB-90]|uniref:hypothetical protein n=1 Tax=Cyanophyceae TaxID=3028117 RepID=UPI0016870339|nr:hypothetical protein [Trichocoleus sp. FACHB-90]MBD1927513.1 hypothetical protein [Trichocoleus sp. FACHB-90]
MSPSSTGRYQSRLFNFLSQASLKLKDERDRAFRNLKVATVWGVQILLYPVYLLVQTSQLAGKQLQQAAPEGFPQLDASNKDNQKNRSSSQTTPAADTPIQQVLLALSGGESEISNPPLAVSGKNEFLNFLTDTVNRVSAAWWGFKLFNNNSLARSSQPENLTLQPASLKEKGGKLFFTPLLGEGLAESSESCALTIQLSEDVLPYSKTSIRTSTQSSEVSPAGIKVQGVATLLNTRSLVLVTAENQILDILSHQQQQKLQQRISWELADYWHQLRLVQASARRSRMRLQPPADQRNILPPVRVFWGLMAWVQRGPVAIAANVFQEITFGSIAVQSPSRPATQPQESNITLHPTSFIFQLDRTVAEIEVRQQDFLANLKPGLELEKIYQFPLQRLQTLFDKPQKQPTSPDVTNTQSLKIQALIRAAIDYFFGKGDAKLSGQETPVINSGSNKEINQLKGRSWTSLFSRQPSRKLAAADVADPWLTMDDLFGKTSPKKEKINNAQQTSQLSGTKARMALPVAENTEVSVKDSIWNVVKRNLFRQNDLPQSEPATTGEIIHRKASNVTTQKKEVVRKSKTSVARTRQLPVTSVLDANSSNANAIAPVTGNRFATHTPDWIEADAQPAGYVKHPLEYLLEWLDAAMLWLENLVVKIWQWANRKTKGRR